MRVNSENGKLGLLQGLRVPVGGLLQQHTESSLEVDRQAGRVLATNVETLGELNCARLHEHHVGGRAQHVASDELEANESPGGDAF